MFKSSASSISGESVIGSLGASVAGVASSVIPGPIKTIGNGFKSFFSSIKNGFKNPAKLIPAIILAVIWLVIDILIACGVNPPFVQFLSFLTFANGGMSGGFIGAIGGLIGKGLFAAAITSLIGLMTIKKSGNKRSFGETIKGAFGVTLDTLFAYLTGIGAAMFLFLFISGGATRISFMGGVATTFLTAKAALNYGFLQSLFASFTSKGKMKAGPGVAGITRGLATGFAASSLLGLIGVNLILIILGSVLMSGGIVLMILQATGVIKFRKDGDKA